MDGAIDTLGFTHNASSEEKPVGGLRSTTISENDRPQSIKNDFFAILVLQSAQVYTSTIIVSINPSCTEGSNQQSSAVISETGWCHGDTPRGGQGSLCGESSDEFTIVAEDGYESGAQFGDFVACYGITHGIGDEDVAQNVGDAEGGVSRQGLGIDEGRCAEINLLPFAVEDSYDTFLVFWFCW